MTTTPYQRLFSMTFQRLFKNSCKNENADYPPVHNGLFFCTQMLRIVYWIVKSLKIWNWGYLLIVKAHKKVKVTNSHKIFNPRFNFRPRFYSSRTFIQTAFLFENLTTKTALIVKGVGGVVAANLKGCP